MATLVPREFRRTRVALDRQSLLVPLPVPDPDPDPGGGGGGGGGGITLNLSPISGIIQTGQTLQLTVSGQIAGVVWTSGNQNLATVSGTGLVSGVAVGVVVITVSSAGATPASSTITVIATPPPPVVNPTAVLAVSGAEQNPISVITVGTNGGSAAIASGTLNWGDGEILAFTGAPSAIYSHTYAVDDASYTITLTVLTTTSLSAADHVDVTVPAAPPATGTVIFDASPDHADVISYEARLHPVGSSAIIDAVNLGKPTPVAGVITVDLTSFFAQQALGVYTLTVAAIGADGTADSMYSNEFSLPL